MKQKDFQNYPLKSYHSLKELIPYIRPYSSSLLKTFFALCGAAFSILAIGPSLRFLIDSGFQNENLGFLYKAISILIFLSLILAFSAYIRLFSTSWLAERIVTDLRKDVFAHLLKLDASFFDQTRLGDIIARLSDDCTLLKTLLSSSGAVFIRGLIQLIGALILMFFTSWKLIFFSFLIIPLIFLPLGILGRRLKKKTLEVQNAQGDFLSYTEEQISGIHTIHAFTQEEKIINEFKSYGTLNLKISRENLRLRALLISLIIGCVFISLSIILSLGGYDVLSKNLSPGTFFSFLFYALIAAGSFNEIAEVIGDFQKASAAMSRLLEILKTPSKLTSSPTIFSLKKHPKTHIRFNNVSFSYPTRPQAEALENLSFDIQKGEKIALIGPSGAGKSTVFKLLLRFYDPHTESIFINEEQITTLPLKNLRQNFAWVSQETTLFHDTLYQNIAFARPEATHLEIMQAAEAAYINEFIPSLPQGFKTIVGNQGKQLSGGQRQRVAIARALLKNAPILLLDEATNALDPQSEIFIQQAIPNLLKDRTTLVIAHHLRTIQTCDRILVLNKGKLSQEGTHQTLIKTAGLYHQLYAKQFLTEKD